MSTRKAPYNAFQAGIVTALAAAIVVVVASLVSAVSGMEAFI